MPCLNCNDEWPNLNSTGRAEIFRLLMRCGWAIKPIVCGTIQAGKLRCPSGRAFGCAGTTPAACFRHSASIANARGGSGHFASAPHRRGFRKTGLNRRRTDTSEMEQLRPVDHTAGSRKAPETGIGMASQGYRRSIARAVISAASNPAVRRGSENAAERRSRTRRRLPGRDDEDQAAKHRPTKAAPFPFSSVRRRDGRHCRIPPIS